jgi:hypothetical protein
MANKLPLVIGGPDGVRTIAPGDSIPVTAGGTGGTTASEAKTNLDLNNVENKSSATIRSEITAQNISDALGFLPSEGGGGGGTTYYSATIDFGSKFIKSKSFQIANASALTTKKVMVVPAPDSDEYEMDALSCSGFCKVNGTVTIYVTAVPGPVRGTRKITYWLG